MKPENRFKAVSRFAKVAILAVFCTLAVGCSKDHKMEIPDNLSDSVWSMWTEEGSKELAFHSLFECTLTETPLDGTPVEYRYVYKYKNHELKLRPYDEGRGEELTGRVFRWDDHSIGLSLHSAADGSTVFNASKADCNWPWAE